MNKKQFLLFTLSVLLCTATSASAQIAMGTWRTHFAYNSVMQIAQSANKVYAMSEGALFSVDKRDNNVEYYSRISGLNGTSIARIAYDETTQCLLIAYIDGNIDLLFSGGVENVADLYNKQLNSGKQINDIAFFDGKAYLSCEFGIVVVDIRQREITETYYIGANAADVNVLATALNNGKIYASSADAMYVADLNSPNLMNYESWSTMTNLPDNTTLGKIRTFAGHLYLIQGEHLYVQETDTTWSPLLTGIGVFNISPVNGHLLASSNSTFFWDASASAPTTFNYVPTTLNTFDALYDAPNACYWAAAADMGIVCLSATDGSFVNNFVPNGPANNTPYRMKFAGEKLFVVPGGRGGVQYNRPGYVMMYEQGQWHSIMNSDIVAFDGQPASDFMDVAADPTDASHFYVTSFGAGLYEFRNNQIYAHYLPDNSAIETAVASHPEWYTRADGGVFDANGNMWFSNTHTNVTYNLKAITPQGQWLGFRYGSLLQQETLGQVLIPANDPNRKWILSCRVNPGILVYDDKGTLTNASDDQAIFLNRFYDQDQTLVSPENIWCFAQDHDNDIWVGTNVGPLIFSNVANAFANGYSCRRIKIARNDGSGLADFLLENEEINAIAIDGANRKWIGTKNSGAYLMSDNGQETVKHFTTANSPLLSNNILSIAINPVTGEVFFGTGGGLLSYQSDAAEAGNAFTDITAYPNPVRENFGGTITIRGLVDNTTVKITDAAGHVVCDTRSNGSLAVWDGKNQFGRRVSAGVYIVICVNEDGTERGRTKILVIK